MKGNLNIAAKQQDLVSNQYKFHEVRSFSAGEISSRNEIDRILNVFEQIEERFKEQTEIRIKVEKNAMKTKQKKKKSLIQDLKWEREQDMQLRCEQFLQSHRYLN